MTRNQGTSQSASGGEVPRSPASQAPPASQESNSAKTSRSDSPSTETVRQRAEQLARSSRLDIGAMSREEVQQLVDRFQVDQLEWELQAQELRDIQARLGRAHDRYFRLYEHAPIAYLTLSDEGVIHEANLTAANLLMCERSFLIGRKLASFVTDESRKDFSRQWEATLESQFRTTGELRMKRCDGKEFPAQVDIEPPLSENLAIESGRIVEMGVAVSDIRVRKSAEAIVEGRSQELERRVEERTQSLRTVCDIASLATQTEDFETAVQYVLQRVCEYNGWCCGHAWMPAADNPRELIAGYSWYADSTSRHARIHEAVSRMRVRAGEGLAGRAFAARDTAFTARISSDLAAPKALLAERMGIRSACAFPIETGETCAGVLEFFSKKPIDPSEQLLATMSSVGRLLGYVIQRVHVAEALRRENELSENIIRTAQMIVLLLDTDGRILRFNPYMEQLTGWRLDEVRGEDWFERFVPEPELPAVRQVFQRATGGKSTRANVNAILTRGGEQREIEWHDAPLSSPEGETIGLLCIGRDVTESKRYERALLDSAERTRAILASLSAQIAVLDSDGKIVAVNPSWRDFAKTNGGSPDRCGIGVNYLDVCREARGDWADEAPRVLEGLSRLLAGELDNFALEYPCHSQSKRRWFLLQATPLRDARGGAVVSHTNITARLLAEERSRESEQRLRGIVNAAPDAIVTFDGQGFMHSVNPATERMFGYSADELLGRDVSLLFRAPHPVKHGRSVKSRGGPDPRRLDGDAHQVIGGGQQVIGGARHVIRDQQELMGRRKDRTEFPIELSISEVESLQIFIGIVRDVTERKELERQVVEASAEEQRRIGQDIHDGVGQELTGLRYMAQTHLETLIAQSSPEAKTAQRMTQWLETVQRQFRNIIRQLIPVEVDTQGLVAALHELARRTTESHHLECQFLCDQPVTVTSPGLATQLYRIAQEAVANAVRHARAQRVTIELWEEREPGSQEHLTVEVRDDGIGIRNPDTSGDGIGLRTMAYRAGLIGAQLSIESRQQGGTAVTCVVPLRDRQQQGSGQ